MMKYLSEVSLWMIDWDRKELLSTTSNSVPSVGGKQALFVFIEAYLFMFLIIRAISSLSDYNEQAIKYSIYFIKCFA